MKKPYKSIKPRKYNSIVIKHIRLNTTIIFFNLNQNAIANEITAIIHIMING